ncbi:flavin reductase family protein [Puia sp. P3]|uniref:flavin reductase family protein n=1 Tax=Puia sp. P3 TaxID=3423952 RepID=UPI003D66A5AA
MQSAVAPRPICFASTIDGEGRVNLSPFSFFNLFGTTPPILIFSPSRRVRDNSTKHTWHNIQEVPEVVINIVDLPMVQQTSLSSCDYPKEVNEFTKAGFTEEPATLVRPPMVKESKIKIECRVVETKSLGEEGGSGNLVFCEALRMHIDPSILDDNKKFIDQRRIRLVARLGGDWYCHTGEQNLFLVQKPNTRLGIGMDALPDPIRNSRILSGNHLGQLANVHEMPAVDPSFEDDRLRQIFQYYSVSPEEMEKELHAYAARLLDEGKVAEAWQVLLALN